MRRPGWIIASVVMVLITFALLAFDPLTAPAPSPASGSTRGADVESGTGDGAPTTVPERTEAGGGVVVGSQPASATSESASTSGVTFTVVDETYRPVVGARIELAHSSTVGFELLKEIAAATHSGVQVLHTDAGGHAITAVTRDLDYAFEVTAVGFESSSGSVTGGDTRVVHLARSCAVHVSVQVDGDLRRFPRLEIASIREAPFVRRAFAITDGVGERTVHLAPGAWALRAESATGYSNTERVVLGSNGPAPARVVLRIGPVASRCGQVVEADTGAPIAGARVAWHLDWRNAALTDAAGRFEIAQPDGDWARPAFCAGAAGAMPGHSPVAVTLTEPFTLVRLPRARPMQGLVLAPDGGAVAGALVVAVAYDRGHGQRLEFLRTTTDAQGKWCLGGLRADDVFWFAAMKAGHGPALEFRRVDADAAPLHLVLTAPANLVGTLASSDGGTRDGSVRLRLLDAPTGAIHLRKPVVLERHLSDREVPLVRSRFHADGLRPGRYALRYVGAHGALTTSEITLAAGRNVVELAEASGLAISGSLRVTGGVASSDHHYMIVLEGDDSAGDLVHRGTRLAPGELTYRFGGVKLGNYRVRAVALGLTGAVSTEVHVVGGERDVSLTIDITGTTPAKARTGGITR